MRQPPCHCAKSLLQLHSRERLAEAAVHTAAEDQVPARMIGAMDVELICVFVESRVTHSRHRRERDERLGWQHMASEIDLRQGKAWKRTNRRFVAQRLRHGT